MAQNRRPGGRKSVRTLDEPFLPCLDRGARADDGVGCRQLADRVDGRHELSQWAGFLVGRQLYAGEPGEPVADERLKDEQQGGQGGEPGADCCCRH